MAVTPTDSLSLRNYNLREAIAGSAWFQSWTGSADAAAARARVALGERTPATAPTIPYAHIQQTVSAEGERVAISTAVTRSTHRIEMVGQVDAANGDSEQDAALDAMNQVGAFRAMLDALSGGTAVGSTLVTFSPPSQETVGDGGQVWAFFSLAEQAAGAKRYTHFFAVFQVRMGAEF